MNLLTVSDLPSLASCACDVPATITIRRHCRSDILFLWPLLTLSVTAISMSDVSAFTHSADGFLPRRDIIYDRRIW